MAGDLQNDLVAFHRFIGEQLRIGGSELSPEEALDEWRGQHPAAQDRDETVLALREALADMQAGDSGKPLAEFDREFRSRRNLSTGK